MPAAKLALHVVTCQSWALASKDESALKVLGKPILPKRVPSDASDAVFGESPLAKLDGPQYGSFLKKYCRKLSIG